MKQALIDCKDVSLTIGLSRSSIWRLEKAGKFPKRITLSNRCVRWSKQEVDQWVDARIEGRA
ncbi:MAG: AlpA family phage regulatory protein [Cycloclasticus sp.]|jgi:Predicted transcriptional regulator